MKILIANISETRKNDNFLLTEEGVEMSPERETRQLIKKIRRQIRLLNRKWAELNQGCNEWQASLDEVSEVCTVLVIIKLMKFPVPVRLCCDSGKLNFCHYFIMFCDIQERCT